MTREQAREAAAVMLAFADGKEVQVRVRGGTAPWTHHSNLLDGTWDWDAFEFRIKPTATLRPWTADEVPLGAWLRSKEGSWRSLILAVDSDGRIIGHYRGIEREAAFEHCEHSLDNGKTWLPCGVMEEAK